MTEKQRIFLKRFKRILIFIVTAIWIVVSALTLFVGAALGGLSYVFGVIIVPITIIYAVIVYLLSEEKLREKFAQKIIFIIVAMWCVVYTMLLIPRVVFGEYYGYDILEEMEAVILPLFIAWGILKLLRSNKRCDIQQHVQFFLDEELAVIVNIHANKRLTALSGNKVKSALQKYHVVVLEEDITKYHDELMEFIRSHNQNSVPLTIVYGRNARDGIVLSKDLSEDEVVAAIEKAVGAVKS